RMMGGMPGMAMGGAAGGTFQGGFNGSLGTMGATQAMGLIDIITTLVEPGKWNAPTAMPPFMMMPFPGFMMGMPAAMMGAPAMPVGPTPPNPEFNTINFFPPAMALIVRAPSRMHTSEYGAIV